MPIVIRKVQESDIPAIAAIYAEAVANSCASWEWQSPDQQEMNRRRLAITNNGYPYLVAALDEAVVGYAYANAFRDRAAYAPVVENSIYISESVRGSGVGKQLLMALIDECTDMGYRQMIAVIGDDDKTASVALHERCGFEVMGRFPGIGWKHNHWMELVMMLRPLGEGTQSAPKVAERTR